MSDLYYIYDQRCFFLSLHSRLIKKEGLFWLFEMLSSRIDWSSGNCNWYELFCLFVFCSTNILKCHWPLHLLYIAKVFSFSKFIPQCCTNINDEDDILSHLTIFLKATVLHYSTIRYRYFIYIKWVYSQFLLSTTVPLPFQLAVSLVYQRPTYITFISTLSLYPFHYHFK